MFNNFSHEEMVITFLAFGSSLLILPYFGAIPLFISIMLYLGFLLLNNFNILTHYRQFQKRLRTFSQDPAYTQDRDIQEFVKEAKKAYFSSTSKHQVWNVIHLMTLAWLKWRQRNMSTVFCYKYLLKNIYADSNLGKESAHTISKILYDEFSSSTNNGVGALIHYLKSNGHPTKEPDWNEDSAIKFTNF